MLDKVARPLLHGRLNSTFADQLGHAARIEQEGIRFRIALVYDLCIPRTRDPLRKLADRSRRAANVVNAGGTLWADLPLGVLFGLILWIYFSGDDSRVVRIFRIAPIVLCLPLIKQMGLVFALIAALVISVDVIFSQRRNAFFGLLTVGVAVVAAIAIDASWRSYLSDHGIQRTFQSNFGVVEVFKAFIPAYSSPRQKITIEAFANHFFGKTHFTTYWILLSGCAAIAAYKSSAEDKKYEVAVQVGGAFLGLLLYLALLLVLYMFTFSEFEGTRVASINRYTNTYLLGLLIGFGGLFVANVCSGRSCKHEKIWIGVVAFLFIAPNFGRIVNDVVRGVTGVAAPYLASEIRAQGDEVSRVTPQNAKIYFLWAGGSNDESVIFNYSIHPRTSNTSCSNIRPKSAKSDESEPNICWLDPAEAFSRLVKHDYVFVGKVSDELRSLLFAPLGMHEVPSGAIYSIVDKAGTLKLERVDPKAPVAP